jgi:hypothetical protein
MQQGRSVHRAGDYEVIDEVAPADVAAQTRTVLTTYKLRGTVLARVEWKQRYSFRFELEHLLEKAGFAILHLWGDYRRTSFGVATDRLFVVARKPHHEEDDLAIHAQAIVTETA